MEELGGALETAEAELTRTKEALQHAEAARDEARRALEEGQGGEVRLIDRSTDRVYVCYPTHVYMCVWQASAGAHAAEGLATELGARIAELEEENRRLRADVAEARWGQQAQDDTELRAAQAEIRELKRRLEDLGAGKEDGAKQLKAVR